MLKNKVERVEKNQVMTIIGLKKQLKEEGIKHGMQNKENLYVISYK